MTLDRHGSARWGCGLSELEVDDFSVDVWVRDLEAVVDAAGSNDSRCWGSRRAGRWPSSTRPGIRSGSAT